MLTPSLICLPLMAPAASLNGPETVAPLAPPATVAAPAVPSSSALLQDDALYGDASWHTLRWKYLQFDRQAGDPDGWNFSGSYPISENIYLAAENLFFQESGVNGSVLKLGGGYHQPIDLGIGDDDLFSETEWYGQVFFQNIDVAGFQETGFEIGGGLRSIITDRIEGQIEFGYTDIDSTSLNDFYFMVRGEYEFTRNLAGTVGFQIDDEEFLNVGVRFYPDMQ